MGLGGRQRLTYHQVPRAALYLAKGKCPSCKKRGGIKVKGDSIACIRCEWTGSVSKIEKRIRTKRGSR